MAENLCVKKSPVESILECPLCLHQLTLPQTLQQCLHSYCKSCLDKVPQKTQDGHKGWLCPICENFSKCEQIQQNTFLEELQKVHSEPKNDRKIKCEQCLDDCGDATWKCAECKIGLCENGKAVHLKIPMLKGHKILPLEKDGEMLIDNIVYCKVHDGVPAQLNCLDCDQLICYTCNTTNHNGHIAETVEEALGRMLPETERSARQVDENISIIKAKIEGVNREIEQTRESYASCRMQIEDHLEKVICQMRAMKAQMEEDVNDQESIALDTLKELNQQLEKQLSQAKILSNLTAVVTTKTRHTSQLQQLQTGLFEKVKSAGKVKNQSLCYNLPATNFIEGRRFQEDIENIFGKLALDLNEQFISIAGDSYTKPNQLLCIDFNELAGIQFKKDKEIVVNTRWCNRLSYVNNKLCLPLGSSNKINVYDEDGQLENVIDTGDKCIAVVKAAHNGDIICAGDSGLYVTDKQFSKWAKLSEGKYSDVVIDNDQCIALQYDDPSMHNYSTLRSLNNGDETLWHESHSFMLNKDMKVDSLSSICISGEQYLFIALLRAKSLYKLTLEGETLDSCKDLPFNPVICGTDQNAQVLVADVVNGTMYLFKPLPEKLIHRTAILADVHTPLTRSVVIDQKNNIWVLSGRTVIKLIKFTSEE